MAQSVERATSDPQVAGSKPPRGNWLAITYQLLSKAEITGVVPTHRGTSAVFALGYTHLATLRGRQMSSSVPVVVLRVNIAEQKKLCRYTLLYR